VRAERVDEVMKQRLSQRNFEFGNNPKSFMSSHQEMESKIKKLYEAGVKNDVAVKADPLPKATFNFDHSPTRYVSEAKSSFVDVKSNFQPSSSLKSKM
jgi:hypothetical protein